MTSALPLPVTSAACTSCQPAAGFHRPSDTLVNQTLVPLPVARPAHQPPALVRPITSALPSPLRSAVWTSFQPAPAYHWPSGTLTKWTLVPLPVAMPAHQLPVLVMPTTSALPSPLRSATCTSCQPTVGPQTP